MVDESALRAARQAGQQAERFEQDLAHYGNLTRKRLFAELESMPSTAHPGDVHECWLQIKMLTKVLETVKSIANDGQMAADELKAKETQRGEGQDDLT